MNKDIFVMDACALIAFFNGEKGSTVILKLFKKAQKEEAKLFLHAINLCEIYYDCYRSSSKEKALELLNKIEKLPVEIIYEVDRELIEEAGRFKATERLSLADAFAVALSVIKKGRLVRSDHGEFDVIEKKGLAEFYWLR